MVLWHLIPMTCSWMLIWEERELWVNSKLFYNLCDYFSESYWEYRGYEYFRNYPNSKSTSIWISLIWSIDHQKVWATSKILYTTVCLFNQLSNGQHKYVQYEYTQNMCPQHYNLMTNSQLVSMKEHSLKVILRFSTTNFSVSLSFYVTDTS